MTSLVPVIGMEIHVELDTASKMFCRCANNPFVDQPNVNVCEICLAHPGTLPVPNRAAIAATVKIAKALKCTVNRESKFDRKHYFYPDLPKAYQISQYDEPIGEHGEIVLTFFHTQDENFRAEATVGITRVHLEEDTAKLNHGAGETTLVDFNRAGVPLVEIVSEPDVESALEAKTYCQELQLIFRHLGVAHADMEKGEMRCEANVSLQEAGKFKKESGTIVPVGDYRLNPKVEVKNINSFRAVEKAIAYEIDRQTKLLENGETWTQETRGWDDGNGTTVRQRFKETAADYRYFPEPDIPPFSPLMVAGDIDVGELPAAKRERFHAEYGFSYADSYLLTLESAWAGYAEKVMSELNDWLHSLPETHDCVDKNKNTDRPPACQTAQSLARLAGGWLTSKLTGAMKERELTIEKLAIKPENFAELIALVYAGRVNSTNAQKILWEMLSSRVNLDPTHVMEEKGYGQVSDAETVGKIVDQVIADYPQQVNDFRGGKEPVIKFLIGLVMKASEGSADPAVAEKLLREKLKK